MPTKIIEFLACGRPVVVNKRPGNFDKYNHEFKSGIVINDKQSNMGENSQMLIELLQDPETPFKNRVLAKEYFDRQRGAEKYFSLNRKIQDHNHPPTRVNRKVGNAFLNPAPSSENLSTTVSPQRRMID